jgi:transketolase
VRDALAGPDGVAARIVSLGVTEMPGSGSPEELRAWAGIDADAIVAAVRAARD